MRVAVMGLVFAAGLATAGAAAAQSAPEHHGDGVVIYGPGALGVEAGTPSRIDSSRLEMNRDRNRDLDVVSGGPALRARADAALHRGGLVCTVLEAAVIGRARGGEPLMEVDCAEGDGLIIADTDPVRATSCRDLAPPAGPPVRGRRVVTACRLAGNVAAGPADHSARN